MYSIQCLFFNVNVDNISLDTWSKRKLGEILNNEILLVIGGNTFRIVWCVGMYVLLIHTASLVMRDLFRRWMQHSKITRKVYVNICPIRPFSRVIASYVPRQPVMDYLYNRCSERPPCISMHACMSCHWSVALWTFPGVTRTLKPVVDFACRNSYYHIKFAITRKEGSLIIEIRFVLLNTIKLQNYGFKLILCIIIRFIYKWIHMRIMNFD